MKFGADWRQLTPAANQANHNNNITFTGTTCPAGSGFTGLPGFLCGVANLANIQHLVPLHFRIRQYSFFGQDTWKISSRLTATYGARWDINPPPEFLTFPAYAADPNGFDPTNCCNLTGLAECLRSLGYLKTYYGCPGHAWWFASEIRRV